MGTPRALESGLHACDKMVLVYSRYAGSSAYRKLVFTGSHNWTASANYENDELFVKVDSAAMYDAFYGHFNNNYNSGTSL
jgi:phosphatidylserine/phosphatidylglycerophosphate/cardiolipin synthase-like enzyme